ncbi:hypothetical protein TWF703_003760 [Orbilia oligospora]|uniref:Uncharacterized protein n=1 Tax=Orbilia oligospora TaxID=2813651 RepID=A0A7C8K1R2_ORBOL|nr:hypothetical protein TWF703_003760 [Orbilia oligospora]
MKRLSSNIFNFALAAQILSFLCIGSVYGLIIKVRHYDFIRGGTYDLTLCRPLGANKVVLLEKNCDGISSMPGWRARELDGSAYQPPRTLLDLFGPPFGPVTEGTYEEPRPWASWMGSLFYNKDPWKPIMFRSSYNPEEGYEWRLPFETQRNGQPFVVTPAGPLRAGDTLDTANNVDDTSMTLLYYPSLVSCNSPSGRVLRRAPSFNRPNARVILDYEAIKRYGDADCRAVQFIISDVGYIDSSYPILPPEDPYPLDLIPITEESSSTGGSTAGSLAELNDQSWTSSAYATSSDGSDTISETSSDEFDDDLMSEDDPEWDALTKELEAEWEKNGQSLEDINMDDAKVEQVIRQYWASPEAENFDQDVLRYQLDSLGTVDDLEAEIARLEDEDLQKFLSN